MSNEFFPVIHSKTKNKNFVQYHFYSSDLLVFALIKLLLKIINLKHQHYTIGAVEPFDGLMNNNFFILIVILVSFSLNFSIMNIYHK